MDNLDSADAFNYAMELFKNFWHVEVPRYDPCLVKLSHSEYNWGSHAKWFTGMFNDQNGLEKNNDVHKNELRDIMDGDAFNIIQDISRSCEAIQVFGTSRIRNYIPTHPLDLTPKTSTLWTLRRVEEMFVSAGHYEQHIKRINARDASLLTMLELRPQMCARAGDILESSLHIANADLTRIQVDIPAARKRLEDAIRDTTQVGALEGLARAIRDLDRKRKALQTNIENMEKRRTTINSTPMRSFAVPAYGLRVRLANGTIGAVELKKFFDVWTKRAHPTLDEPACATIDQYLSMCHRFHTITEIPIKGSSTINFKCTCEKGMQYQVCAHSIYYSQQEGTFKTPTQYTPEGVASKTPGRKRSKSPPASSREVQRARMDIDTAVAATQALQAHGTTQATAAMGLPAAAAHTADNVPTDDHNESDPIVIADAENEFAAAHTAAAYTVLADGASSLDASLSLEHSLPKCSMCSLHEPGMLGPWIPHVTCMNTYCNIGMCESCASNGVQNAQGDALCRTCIEEANAALDEPPASLVGIAPPVPLTPPPPPGYSPVSEEAQLQDRSEADRIGHDLEQAFNGDGENAGYTMSDLGARGAGGAWNVARRSSSSS